MHIQTMCGAYRMGETINLALLPCGGCAFFIL